MDRDCKNCVYHSSGSCSQWDCDFTTVKGLITRTVDKFEEWLKSEKIVATSAFTRELLIERNGVWVNAFSIYKKEQLKTGGKM